MSSLDLSGIGVQQRGDLAVLTPRWQRDAGDVVTALAFAPEGERVAVAVAEGDTLLLEAETGGTLQRLPSPLLGTSALAFSPDGTLLATAGQEPVARLWEAASGREVAALEGGAAWLGPLAWSPDGAVLATASGKHVRLWRRDGTLLHELEPPPSTVNGLAWFAYQGQPTLAGCFYGGVALWRAESPRTVRSYRWQGAPLNVHAQPNGRYLALGSQDASVHIVEVKSGKELEMSGYPLKVKELSFRSDGRFLATGGGPELILWDLSGPGPQGRSARVVPVHDGPIADLAFEPAGDRLATGGEDGMVFLLGGSLKQHLELYGVAPMAAAVTRLAWHPQGEALVVGDASGAVVLLCTPRLVP